MQSILQNWKFLFFEIKSVNCFYFQVLLKYSRPLKKKSLLIENYYFSGGGGERLAADTYFKLDDNTCFPVDVYIPI